MPERRGGARAQPRQRGSRWNASPARARPASAAARLPRWTRAHARPLATALLDPRATLLALEQRSMRPRCSGRSGGGRRKRWPGAGERMRRGRATEKTVRDGGEVGCPVRSIWWDGGIPHPKGIFPIRMTPFPICLNQTWGKVESSHPISLHSTIQTHAY